MDKKGLLVIISGPSGAGKGTVVTELIKDSQYSLSISATTRNPRVGEVEGVHYFFKTNEEFEKMIADGEFLEYAQFCENYYGTNINYVNEMLKKGKNVLLEIEVQGALQVKEKCPDAILIFLTPENKDELRRRLEKRDTETPEKINMRIDRAKEEVILIDKYDYIVKNNIVSEAVKDINKIVDVERMVANRNTHIIDIFLRGDNNLC